MCLAPACLPNTESINAKATEKFFTKNSCFFLLKMMDNGAFLKAGAFKSTKNSVRALFYLILFPYIDNIPSVTR